MTEGTRETEGFEREYEPIFTDSGEMAEWVMRTITTLDAVSERVRQNTKAIINANKRHRDWLLRRFGPELEQWCREKFGENPGSKTVRLLHGTISRRKLPGRTKEAIYICGHRIGEDED